MTLLNSISGSPVVPFSLTASARVLAVVFTTDNIYVSQGFSAEIMGTGGGGGGTYTGYCGDDNCDTPYESAVVCPQDCPSVCGNGIGAASWLADIIAGNRRFCQQRCNENRTMTNLTIVARNDRGLYVSGGLGGLQAEEFGVWVCIAGHPCLEAVGAAVGDRMCYVVEGSGGPSKMHPYGLNSELKLCNKPTA